MKYLQQFSISSAGEVLYYGLPFGSGVKFYCGKIVANNDL